MTTRIPSQRLRCSIVKLMMLVLCLFAVAANAQTPPPYSNLTADQRAVVSKLLPSGSSGDTKYANMPGPIGAKIVLPFQNGQITLVRTKSLPREDGSVTWYGEVQETGERAMLMLWGSALLTGYFAYDGTIYAIENLGGDIKTFKELGRGKQIPDHPIAKGSSTRDAAAVTSSISDAPPAAPPEPAVPAFADEKRRALEAKKITIDLLLLYTGNVAKEYSRVPEDLLALAVEEANQSFQNSGLGNISLRLVHSQVIDYDGSSNDQFSHLYTLVDGLGPFKGVKALRNEKRADIVGLIIDNPNGCGLSTRVGPDSDEAFFVVHHACALTTHSIAHEIGHIIGIRHDRFEDNSDTPFAYGHGYINGLKWRDIMSYNHGCHGCPRIPFWSNPRINYKGEPTGTAAADSARVILEIAERVSNFR